MSVRKVVICSTLFCFLLVAGCSVYQTFQNISRLKFKLGAVNGLLLDGITVSNKTRIQDFNALDILKLTTDVTNKRLPVSFILNVNALNPNTGKGGYSKTDVSLKSFPWKLLIDDKETVSGDIASPISVPGVGDSVVFPIKIEMDLFKYFQDKGYQGLVDLALKLGGQNKDPLKIKLVAQPTVSSMLGDIKYPGELTIVQTEYR
ncbi:MAG: hypothetical protein Q8933_12945 [Bacteroidota bacterium]|nr:hypothetical protein [Bacteroidota bacterium]MDP4193992.1 hypothetical protein [Bacteroidota bacterium]